MWWHGEKSAVRGRTLHARHMLFASACCTRRSSCCSCCLSCMDCCCSVLRSFCSFWLAVCSSNMRRLSSTCELGTAVVDSAAALAGSDLVIIPRIGPCQCDALPCEWSQTYVNQALVCAVSQCGQVTFWADQVRSRAQCRYCSWPPLASHALVALDLLHLFWQYWLHVVERCRSVFWPLLQLMDLLARVLLALMREWG